MKAKVKNTGEIVDVSPSGVTSAQRICTKYVTKDGREFNYLVLEFLPDADWEQRRYEIAKEVLASSFSTPMEGVSIMSYIHDCVHIADMLIEELRGSKE